jgi:hypothetical protein
MSGLNNAIVEVLKFKIIQFRWSSNRNPQVQTDTCNRTAKDMASESCLVETVRGGTPNVSFGQLLFENSSWPRSM